MQNFRRKCIEIHFSHRNSKKLMEKKLELSGAKLKARSFS